MYKINKKEEFIEIFNKSEEKTHSISFKQAADAISKYSNGLAISDICSTGISVSAFEALKKELGFSRDSIPLLPHEILDHSSEAMVASYLIQRSNKIRKAAETGLAKNIIDSAKKWDDFLSGTYKPFASVLKRFKGTATVNRDDLPQKTLNASKTLIVALSDTHGGGYANPIYMQDGNGWDKNKFQDFFRSYSSKVREIILNNKPSQIEIFGMGDLFDGLRNQTEKGTLLEQDASYDEQFDLVLNEISSFVADILSFGIPTNIRSVRGNHEGSSNYILFETIKRVFRNETNLKVYNYHTQFGIFAIRNTLFAISHGAHDKFKAKVPTGDRKQSYYQSIFLQHKHLLKDGMNCVAIMGDQHHREMKEYSDFDFYMVGSPAKSNYSDALNLKAKPSQTCFILGDSGIEAVLHCYF